VSALFLPLLHVHHGFPTASSSSTSSSPRTAPRSALPLPGMRRRESPGFGLLRSAVPVLLRVCRERPLQGLPRRDLLHRWAAARPFRQWACLGRRNRHLPGQFSAWYRIVLVVSWTGYVRSSRSPTASLRGLGYSTAFGSSNFRLELGTSIQFVHC
jgi:hypothetical protein